MNLTLDGRKLEQKTESTATEPQDPVIKIEFWHRKRELQISTYSEKVVHLELSNQTEGERERCPKQTLKRQQRLCLWPAKRQRSKARQPTNSHNAFLFSSKILNASI